MAPPKQPDIAQIAATLADEVLDTAPWDAIAPHYARGVVLLVDGPTLSEAGAVLVLDDVKILESWLADGRVRRLTDTDAEQWNASNPSFDILIVEPWVLIATRVADRGQSDAAT